MITSGDLSGPLAALVAGLVTSLHCVGMCGPLACSACAESCGRNSNTAAALYHGWRGLSYLAVGAVAGLAGGRLSDVLLGRPAQTMVWVFALFFLAVAAGLDKRLKLPAAAARWGNLLNRFPGADRSSLYGRASALGAFTPLLPCAPLALVAAAAALSGSAFSGAALMAAFAIGTMPLLFGAQNRLAALQRRWPPGAMEKVRRSLALISAILLLVRAAQPVTSGCPLCP